jgi:hypothetical protein
VPNKTVGHRPPEESGLAGQLPNRWAQRNRYLKILQTILLSSILIISGCGYPQITGRIVDSVSGQPIEGAVVLVEWTKTHGYGLTSTNTFSVSEVISDKSGIVKLPGISDIYVNDPDLTVYKQGYVTWNSNFIFPPGYTKRTDFSWKDGYVFKLEKFKSEYTYRDHTSFIYSAMGTGNIEQKQLLYRAFEWERENSNNEMKKLIEMNKPNR